MSGGHLLQYKPLFVQSVCLPLIRAEPNDTLGAGHHISRILLHVQCTLCRSLVKRAALSSSRSSELRSSSWKHGSDAHEALFSIVSGEVQQRQNPNHLETPKRGHCQPPPAADSMLFTLTVIAAHSASTCPTISLTTSYIPEPLPSSQSQRPSKEAGCFAPALCLCPCRF